MRNSNNAPSTPRQLKFSFRALASVLSVEVALILALIAPFVIGKIWGHGFGLLMAIVDIIAWFYLNHNHFGIKRVALSTQILWLCVLGYVAVAIIIEGTRFCSLTTP